VRRRGCLIGCGGFLGLLLLACIVGYFVGIPRFRDSVGDGISESISTEVSEQLGTGQIGPGTYTLSVGDLQRQLESQLDGQNVEDFGISVTPQELSVSFTSNGQEVGYSGRPVAQDGELVLNDMTVDNDVLGFILPADKLGDAIETGVNGYFSAQELDIESLQLGNDEITVEAVPASGT